MLQKRIAFSLLAAVAVLAACAFAIPAHAASFIPGDVSGALSGFSAMGLGVGGMTAGALAAEHFATKSKWFRIFVEGATSDGRAVDRAWIEQAAKNYDPKMYGARVFLEHIRGISPDSPFKAYGDVLALKAEEVEIGGVKKLALFAQIAPTPELIAMTKAKQKIYTSAEINPKFADTGAAYLVGLAVTDSPASLGTEVLEFAAKNPAVFASRKQAPENIFTVAEETMIEFESPESPSLFSKVKELLGLVTKKATSDDSRFSDVTQAVEMLATHGKEQADAFSQHRDTVAQLVKQLGESNATISKLSTDFAQLKDQLASTGNGQPPRPSATGGNGSIKTDC